MTTQTEITEALNCIPCSSLTRADWLRVGMALHELGASCDEWDDWSASDQERYHSGECFKFWNNFQHGRGVKGATLFYIARQYGYKTSSEVYTNNSSIQSYTALEWDSELDYREFNNYPLIKNITPETLSEYMDKYSQKELSIMQMYNERLDEHVELKQIENYYSYQLEKILYLIEDKTGLPFTDVQLEYLQAFIKYTISFIMEWKKL